MKDSFVFLAHGFEEIETITVIDILRRAGIPVKSVSITDSLQVSGAHGITVTADCIYSDTNFENAEWLICPGGLPGAENLHTYAPLQALLLKHAGEGKKIAAICAAPAMVLCPLGLLDGLKATCYPGFEQYCDKALWTGEAVVASENFVLGNGPANAMHWALKIVEQTAGIDKASEVSAGLLYNDK